MENLKYLGFYALLIGLVVLGYLQKPWLIIIPAAFVLSLAYIVIKGKSWKQVMGKANINGGLVFVGVFVSQIVTAAICFGAGYLLALLFK